MHVEEEDRESVAPYQRRVLKDKGRFGLGITQQQACVTS